MTHFTHNYKKNFFTAIRYIVSYIEQSVAFILDAWTPLPTGIFADFEKVNKQMFVLINLLLKITFRPCSAFYKTLQGNEESAFFASEEHKRYDLWSCQKVTDALIYLLDNIYIRFSSKLYRQNVGIPMGTNCASLLLICFCSAMRGTS